MRRKAMSGRSSLDPMLSQEEYTTMTTHTCSPTPAPADQFAACIGCECIVDDDVAACPNCGGFLFAPRVCANLFNLFTVACSGLLVYGTLAYAVIQLWH
jgi:hypothetical protein